MFSLSYLAELTLTPLTVWTFRSQTWICHYIILPMHPNVQQSHSDLTVLILLRERSKVRHSPQPNIFAKVILCHIKIHTTSGKVLFKIFKYKNVIRIIPSLRPRFHCLAFVLKIISSKVYALVLSLCKESWRMIAHSLLSPFSVLFFILFYQFITVIGLIWTGPSLLCFR